VTAHEAAIKGHEDTLFWQGILSTVMLFKWFKAPPLTTNPSAASPKVLSLLCAVHFICKESIVLRAPKSLPLEGEGTPGLFLQRALDSLIHQPETINDPCVLCLMFFVYFCSVICFQLIVRL
jgi:hypothetical protein